MGTERELSRISVRVFKTGALNHCAAQKPIVLLDYTGVSLQCLHTGIWFDPLLDDTGNDWEYFVFQPGRDIRLFEIGSKEYTFAVMVSSGRNVF